MSTYIASFLSENSTNIAIGAAGAAAVSLAAVLGSRYLRKSNQVEIEPDKASEADLKVQQLLNDLMIKEYYLPTKNDVKARNFSNENANSLEPRPIFNAKTTKEIQTIRQMITQAHLNKSPLPNMVLVGTAGVGKTMLAEDICRQTKVGFIRVPSGAMESQIKIGNHINAFRQLINLVDERADKVGGLPIYFIMDDGEELVRKRPAQNSNARTDTTKAPWLIEQERLSETISQRRIALVNAILEESGKEFRRVSFCITTNRPEVIDQAFLTRCRVVAIDRPTAEERKQIIITHLPTIFENNRDLLSFFNKGRLEVMSLQTDGFTGRNIVKMLEDLAASVQLEKGNITQDLVDASIVAMRASVDRNAGLSSNGILDNISAFGKSLFGSSAA